MARIITRNKQNQVTLNSDTMPLRSFYYTELTFVRDQTLQIPGFDSSKGVILVYPKNNGDSSISYIVTGDTIRFMFSSANAVYIVQAVSLM